MVSSTTPPGVPSAIGYASVSQPRRSLPAFLAGLRLHAALGIWLAIATSVTIWLAASSIAGVSPLIGLVLGLGVLLLAAYLSTGASATWNRSRWQTLHDWGDTIGAGMQSRSGSSNPLLPRLTSAMHRLDAERGPQWISGDGYVSVSRSLAELEVGAMDGASVGTLIDVAQFDKMRLSGSAVENRDALLAELNTAIATLQLAVPGLAIAAAPPAAPPVPAAIAAAAPSSAAAQAAAATTVKDVRRALNDYRDSSRESLANLRRKTFDAVALAGVLGFFLTLLGALTGGSYGVQLASGAALFLVAAIVGVISALNGLASLTKADDDFGLAGARLIATAVLSGLTGVAGVLLIYLSGTAGSLVKSSGTGPTALTDIFDLGKYPVTLLVAAVFGATPSLLLTSLTKLGDKYATNLTSTHPSSTSGAT